MPKSVRAHKTKSQLNEIVEEMRSQNFREINSNGVVKKFMEKYELLEEKEKLQILETGLRVICGRMLSGFKIEMNQFDLPFGGKIRECISIRKNDQEKNHLLIYL
jgi:hypothetical protein